MLIVVREATTEGEVLVDEEDEAVAVGEEETLGVTLGEVLALRVKVKRAGGSIEAVVEVYKNKEN